MSYAPVEDAAPPGEEAMADGEDIGEDIGEDMFDDRSALDKTIDKIGMGYYQWSLLALCGFGWMADNMWLQGIALIMPRVQDHFHISDRSIGILSSSMFCGMMIGAVGWGTCADVMGRRTAFQLTLFFASIFGLASPFMPNYGSLCFCLFFLGSAVGGSMPTDGTLFMENVPLDKQYLLTALSVFFSIGATVSSLLGIIIIPSNSCPENPEVGCDVATQNLGWKYLLGVFGLFTLLMCLARVVLFRMRESPRYLMAAGRPEDAVIALRQIVSYNRHALDVTLEDVLDNFTDGDDEPAIPHRAGGQDRSSSQEIGGMNYQAVETDPERSVTNGFPNSSTTYRSPDAPYTPPAEHNRQSSIGRAESAVRRIPVVGRSIASWMDRMSILFTPKWWRTTVFIWSVWALISLAYTIFNIFLPKLLEGRAGQVGGGGRKQALRDFLLYGLASIPGPLIGAWMIETRLGRRGSLVLTTAFTGLCTLAFVLANSESAVIVATMAMSLGAMSNWAVLYGLTPEIFSTEVRGSATGMASGLSRISGMIAPIVGGIFLAISPSLPLYASACIFLGATICGCALPPDKARERGARRTAMH